MSDLDNTEKSLKALRTRVESLEDDARRMRAGAGRLVVLAATAGALIALSTATWYVDRPRSGARPMSLWSLAGFDDTAAPALVLLGIIVTLVVAGLALARRAPVTAASWVVGVLSAATVPLMIWLHVAMPGTDNGWSAAGLFTVVCALASAVATGSRGAGGPH
ncbi:MAG TPA: hypothetical protein VM677_16615 [Actinokineospora sp.]|nr:hypothetical protein [Actinokineospora sp.]